ncbi:MAG TPA: hypothetical protein VKG80_15470 [Trebonia sp.]|nr:hypothetical protein [Trebonia sp.]
MAEEPRYRGWRLDELWIIHISWSDWSADHLMQRTKRHPDDPEELNLAAEWATEAALDQYGLLDISKQNDLRVLGWSPNAPAASWSEHRGRVLRVILKPVDIVDGHWSGVTAAPANQTWTRYYWRERARLDLA